MKKNGVKSFCFLGLIIAIILLVIYYYNTEYNLNFINNLEKFSQQDPMVDPQPLIRPRVLPRSDENLPPNQNNISLPPNDPRQYIPYDKQVRYNTYGTEYVPPGQPPTIPPIYQNNYQNGIYSPPVGAGPTPGGQPNRGMGGGPNGRNGPNGPNGRNGPNVPNSPNAPPPNVSDYLIGQTMSNGPANYLYPSQNYTTYNRALPYFARSPEVRTNADGTIPAGTIPPGFNINSEGRLVPTTNILPISYYNS